MCEVNATNFKTLYPEIEKTLKESKFIGLDIEFSGLNPLKEYTSSLFDTPAERYQKLKENVKSIIPLQIGLTAFIFDSKTNSYCGKIFTFYVQPACFQHIHRKFYFQSSTLNFLKSYNFDFNKFVYSGIPFINKDQEQILRKKFKNNECSETNVNCKELLEEILENEGEVIRKWHDKIKPGEFLTVPRVCSKECDNEEIKYFLHQILRSRLKNIWTCTEKGEFIVKKVTNEERDKLEKEDHLDEDLLKHLVGFSNVIRLITSLQKPIIGHNCILDLLLLIHNFEKELPESYTEFKRLIIKLFPIVFDTKTVSYGLLKKIPIDARWNDKGLNHIFNYFKNEQGRHIVKNSPIIDFEHSDDTYGKLHNAGWDSFCTGYIFIRMAHICLYKKYPATKSFVPNEYIGALMEYKNKINLIRCSVPTINLDDTDPISTRPPYLVIESCQNKSLNIQQEHLD
ncbi:pre-piRNA 3'-exonuclease trimmer-like isoform X2 [Rhynchophorus ferrugineus]|uniref:pre-piRNA 3'-exonuclease trimmer-like isoform X2 n=1 Tax=Rhynchophorus ferrugineus TaxID=354439 RepID=UPI003FCC3020